MHLTGRKFLHFENTRMHTVVMYRVKCFNKIIKTNLTSCIPVRCVPPARYRMGGLPDRDPLDREPLNKDPALDRESPSATLDRETPWT